MVMAVWDARGAEGVGADPPCPAVWGMRGGGGGDLPLVVQTNVRRKVCVRELAGSGESTSQQSAQRCGWHRDVRQPSAVLYGCEPESAWPVGPTAGGTEGGVTQSDDGAARGAVSECVAAMPAVGGVADGDGVRWTCFMKSDAS